MTPPVAPAPVQTPPLIDQLDAALAAGPDAPARLAALTGTVPLDRRDRALVLLRVYDLHVAPLEVVGEAARWQGHPAVAELKSRLEAEWLAELDAEPVPADVPTDEGVLTAMRLLAARDRLPAAYKWLSRDASWAEVVEFLAVEGGPDAGFDDLVAACQVGLSGTAKLELAQNYWDEMGNGSLEKVHTVLHDDLVRAIEMPRIPREELPVEALERAALGGLLATNRWLQPEMLGALGLTELQAGPRCRMVLKAFDRLGAPQGAYPFYVEHAEVDPIHGRDWLEKAVGPLGEERPEWVARMLRGAWWRCRTNDALFAVVHEAITSRTAGAEQEARAETVAA